MASDQSNCRRGAALGVDAMPYSALSLRNVPWANETFRGPARILGRGVLWWEVWTTPN
ncbi:hypothetical protein [Brevibacterium aurantiacum]|uniref:hypothetical protein n=1 Tax=Brevibacterium aurantiacum TaxID=273384 RepID=UPI0013FD8C9F|nr:hypothetical protein [Brevibacterium aurantiacum]